MEFRLVRLEMTEVEFSVVVVATCFFPRRNLISRVSIDNFSTTQSVIKFISPKFLLLSSQLRLSRARTKDNFVRLKKVSCSSLIISKLKVIKRIPPKFLPRTTVERETERNEIESITDYGQEEERGGGEEQSGG
jgi:hypothetical protein